VLSVVADKENDRRIFMNILTATIELNILYSAELEYSEPLIVCDFVWHRDSTTNIELLEPAEGSVPGDRVFVEGYDDPETTQPPDLLHPKKKIWDKLQVTDRLAAFSLSLNCK